MDNELIKVEQMPEVASNSFLDKESFAQMCKVAKMFSESSLVPSNFQGKPQDCLIAVDMANRMGVSPMMVMQNLYVVKGKPSWSGQACMSLIQNCGRFKNVHPVYTGIKGTDNRGCYIEATTIVDNTVIQGTEITIDMAKAEGWLSNSKWKNMPEQMLAYRAAAFFARVNCPDALMGMQLSDEIIDIEKEKPTIVDPFAEVKNVTTN
jgi:hypothetical protein